MRKLFGTDGVRGVAGEFLTADLALALGRAAAGGQALLGGVLPTPGAPLLLRRFGFDLAAVVSASHNPYQDNGIKFFGPEGTKLSDEQEAEIERLVGTQDDHAGAAEHPGHVKELHGAEGDYLRELESRFADLDLSGTKVLLDCANGATYRVAPEIFRRLKADVDAFATEPDGRNINEGVGSTHVEALAERVVAGGYDLGFAFDGDGDRVLAVDSTGAVIDGDEL